jgi:hypothetical protein
MPATMTRAVYADMFGPTTGDRVGRGWARDSAQGLAPSAAGLFPGEVRQRLGCFPIFSPWFGFAAA